MRWSGLVLCLALGGCTSQGPPKAPPAASPSAPQSARGPQIAEEATRSFLTRGTVRVSNGEVSAAWLDEVIWRVLRTRQDALRLCYAKELLRDPKLSGRLGVRFTVRSWGDASVVVTSALDAELDRCVMDAIAETAFPTHDGEYWVTFALELTPPTPDPHDSGMARGVIHASLDEVRACAAAESEPQGSLRATARFVVGLDGKVGDMLVVGQVPPAIERCIGASMSALELPANAYGASIVETALWLLW